MIIVCNIAFLFIILLAYYLIYKSFVVVIYGKPPKKESVYTFEQVYKWPKYKINKLVKIPLFSSWKTRLNLIRKSRYCYTNYMANGKCPICNNKLNLIFLFNPKNPTSTNNISVFACYNCKKRSSIEKWY